MAAKTSGGPLGEQRGQLAGAGHQFVGGEDLIDQAPLMGLGHLHPAAGQQEIHGDVIGDAPRQPQRRGIGQGAGLDLRQSEAGMLDRQDHIGGKRPFEAAAHGHAVDRGDDGLVQIGQLLDAAEAARTVILVRRLAGRRGLQIPAGAEEFLAAAGDDGHAQLRIVAEFRRRPGS